MHRAFVVHFRPLDKQAQSLAGRVEHLRSGRMVHFESVGELVEFFVQSLESEEAEESSLSSLNEEKVSNPLPGGQIG